MSPIAKFLYRTSNKQVHIQYAEDVSCCQTTALAYVGGTGPAEPIEIVFDKITKNLEVNQNINIGVN